ncbi:MAG TPA: polysaccharide deacetylase family protein [Allosphingosinicella sp.]|nr:polysaccharide deacetylase family protein [Allosphingosinicella sp.]
MAPSGLLNEWAGCGRLDQPPRERCYIRLPDSFGRRFTIFCDTEEEFDWGRPRHRDNRATTHMRAMPDLQERFRRRGVKPVYLVDHPIATDPAAVEMLRDWMERGECAVGAQLHPWVNPPHEEEVITYNSFAGNLPKALERAKINGLTETIASAFDRRPIVYRAGRYGVGPNTAELLEEAGYEADASVRALFDYGAEGGPDFSRVRPLPFRIGDDALVELPLSAAYVGAFRRRGRGLYRAAGRLPRGRGLLSRTGLLDRVALTPEGVKLPDALAAARALVADGVRWFSLSFHSPSVEPGHTPYVRTADDLRGFHDWWDGMLDFFAAEGIAPASIEETIAAAKAA